MTVQLISHRAPPPASAMVQAVEGNTLARMRFIHRHGRKAHGEASGGAWLTTGIAYPNAFLNLVFLPNEGAAEETGITNTLETIKRWRTPVFWAMPAWMMDDVVDARLQAQELAHEGNVWEMAMALKDLPDELPMPEGFAIERVGSPAQLDSFLQVLTNRHPAPPDVLRQWHAFESSLGLSTESCWQRYVGVIDGLVVATTAVFLCGGAAGVYHVETLSSARGGIASLMTWYGLREAQRRGHTVGALIATPMGLHVYERLGFVSVNTLHCYVRPGWN